MKIVQIASPTAAGGLERVVEALAVGHHRRGLEVSVLTPLLTTEHTPVLEALRSQGVQVHEVRLARPNDYRRERQEVSAYLRRTAPDIVHTHGYRRDLLHRPSAARQGIRTVTTVHGPSKMGGVKGTFLEWLQRRNYRRFDAVVAVSKSLYAETMADRVSPDRLHLIPNAWSGLMEPLPRAVARRKLDLGDSRQVIGWVGRLIHVKGGDVFLDALSRLPHPRPLAVMIGYGPEGDHLREIVTRLDLADDVRFLSNIRDAGRYFSAFDTYVLSSRSEGLPIVILEAMAAHTPVVATAVGGVPDAIGEGEGWLVPSENPQALADAVAESLRDREAASSCAERAATRLERDYGLDAFLDGYERVYRSLAGNRPFQG